jgi:hypothetical protein
MLGDVDPPLQLSKLVFLLLSLAYLFEFGFHLLFLGPCLPLFGLLDFLLELLTRA